MLGQERDHHFGKFVAQHFKMINIRSPFTLSPGAEKPGSRAFD